MIIVAGVGHSHECARLPRPDRPANDLYTYVKIPDQVNLF
jgi:hypothetical protein